MHKLVKIKKSGVALIEMAIILPVFVYLLFTLIYLGISVYDGNTLENIVRQETRYASVQMAANPVLNSNKEYVMSMINRDEVRDKLKLDIEKKCLDKLFFYKLASSEIIYPPSADTWEESEKNERVTVRITIKADESLSAIALDIVPATITKYLVMRIEDHSMVINN